VDSELESLQNAHSKLQRSFEERFCELEEVKAELIRKSTELDGSNAQVKELEGSIQQSLQRAEELEKELDLSRTKVCSVSPFLFLSYLLGL